MMPWPHQGWVHPLTCLQFSKFLKITVPIITLYPSLFFTLYLSWEHFFIKHLRDFVEFELNDQISSRNKWISWHKNEHEALKPRKPLCIFQWKIRPFKIPAYTISVFLDPIYPYLRKYSPQNISSFIPIILYCFFVLYCTFLCRCNKNRLNNHFICLWFILTLWETLNWQFGSQLRSLTNL